MTSKMKKQIFIPLIICTLGLIAILLFLPLYIFAEENNNKIETESKASVTVRNVDGQRESSKFEEYREIPKGSSADLEFWYKKKEKYFLELNAKDISEDDQNLDFKTGWYGKYKLNLIYDIIPHRFAYDAKTLYAGIGSGVLTLAKGMRKDLQDSATKATSDLNGDKKIDAADDSIASSKLLADTIKNDYFASALPTDLQLFRKTGKANIDITAFNPFNLKAELSREKREGTRPFFATFGFGNAVEVAEPINYDTTALKFSAEYAKKPLYLNLSHYISIFDNNIDTLIWDNPYRIADNTAANAYATSYAAGPAIGLIDLYPNNKYNNSSLTGSLDLPLKSRISAVASLAWTAQNDDLVPYTTNSAIKTGAVSGVANVKVPFNTYEKATLPQSSLDGKVNTSLVDLLLISKPLKLVQVKARYRYYNRDNQTEEIKFPGYARDDAVWEPEAIENFPIDYKKSTASVSAGLEVLKATYLTVGYTLDTTERAHREVAKSDDNIFKISLDAKPIPSLLDLKVSYEKAKREGEYDYRVPFEGEEITPQLPWLRKYDQANRDRDRIQGILSVYPLEPLTLTAQVILGKDDFIDSPFGLLDDKHNIYSIDADYELTDQLNLYGFYSQEKYKNSQQARQWSPENLQTPQIEGPSDPYYASGENKYESASNWSTENEDNSNTLGGGLNLNLIEKLDLDVSYLYSKTDGEIKIDSLVGDAKAPDTNRYKPLNFTDVDDVKLRTLNAKLRYNFHESFSIALGYIWEKFDISDFNLKGLDYIPTTLTGAYNAALFMETLTKGYDVNIIYAKLNYIF